MSEYIEREKLSLSLKEWQNTLIETYGKNDEYVRCIESVLIGIESAPAADVRPVVLCRDCVNYGEMLSGYDHRLICHKFALTTKPDDFCSRGERRNCGADMREEQA